MPDDRIHRLNAALEGRYQIQRQLGEGGMATVYLADDLRHERKVALKVLKPELAAVVGAERFLGEIKTTANLQHPHILPLFDSGQADAFLFYVMPYVEGESLRGRLDRERQLPVGEAVGIATNVAEALDYAHRQGVIHRDIKPENVLLQEGQPMVADFGIALALSAAGGGRMTETGLSLGTPHYMSPEQATAEKELTGRSDQYALGCVLYELLTGAPPHIGSSAQQVIVRIVSDEARPVRELRRSVPPNVADAVAKSLEKLPADRFSTAGEFASALRDPTYRSSQRGEGRAGGPSGAPLTSRLPWLVAAAAVVVAVVGWMGRPGPRAVGRPPASFVTASISARSIDLTELVERFAVSPDGLQIVYRSLDRQSGEERLMVRRLEELQASPLSGVNGMAPAFSPDGAWLAVVSDGQLLKVAMDGSVPPVTLAATPDGRGLSWGGDGIIHFFRADEFQRLYWVADTPGSPVDSLVVQGDTVLWSAQALAGGRLLLSMTTGMQDRMVVRDADGAIRDIGQGRHASVTPTGHLLFSRSAGRRWSLVAVPFDPAAAEVTGEEIPLSSDIPVMYGSAAAVSERGDLYLMEGEPRADRRLVFLDRDGREWDTGFDPGPWEWVRVSPTGRKVAVTRWNGAQRSVWVGDLARGTVDRITFEGDRFGPVWSPDETRIAFTYFPQGPSGAAGWTSMWWISTDGRGEPEPIGRGVNAYPASFSPDGRVLYYEVESRSVTEEDIWAVDVPGQAPGTPILETRANEHDANASPDGMWLAYQSSASGQDEVRIGRLPDLAVSVEITSGGGEPIRWSGDSSRFFYARAGDIWEVDVGRSGPDLGTRRLAFELPDDMIAASVMPDGETAVVLRGGPMVADVIVRQGALPMR